MPTLRITPDADVLATTALAATGGGTLLTLEPHGAAAGHADATVLRDGAVLHVRLDATLGTAVVGPATGAISLRRERPTRRCAPAHR